MSEMEWWQLKEPATRLSAFPRPVSRRKDRLFAVGCCYHIWGLMEDERSRTAVEVAERFADGEASIEQLIAAHEAAGAAVEDAEEVWARDATRAAEAASDPDESLGCLVADLTLDASGGLVREVQHTLLLELLGPPFCTITIAPAVISWKDSTVLRIAQAIYAEGAFDRLPILADALEEAGCQEQEVVTHLRSPGQHVRGCWPVDLLTGRE